MKDDELVLLFNVTNIPPYFCQHTTSFEEKKQYWQNLDECLFESDVVGFKRVYKVYAPGDGSCPAQSKLSTRFINFYSIFNFDIGV